MTRTITPTVIPQKTCILLVMILFHSANGFYMPTTHIPRSISLHAPTSRGILCSQHTIHTQWMASPKNQQENDDNNNNNNVSATREQQDSFDAAGFAGYLAPYAAAVLGALVATGLFVKFVLLDY